MACRLSLFGPPRLLDDQGRLISVPAKTFALIAYLVLTNRGEPATRASLRQFLWEDSDPKAAATNMRKFLSRIVERQEKGRFELIRSRRDHIELAKSVEIDLVAFVKLVSHRSPADLVALCNLYRGEFLEGCEWEGTEVQDWLSVQRTKLRDAFVSAIVGCLEPLDPGEDRVATRIAARRLFEVDPYNEVGHRTLMRLFAEDGEPARIRDLYRSLERRLHEDLGVAPDPATTALFRTLLPRHGTVKAVLQDSKEAAAPARESLTLHRAAPDASYSSRAPVIPNRAGAPKVTVLPPLPVRGLDYHHQISVSLVEDVTLGLCRLKSLSVVAPHTAAELTTNGKKALLRTFGIDYAVETKLQNRGGNIWLSARLVDATNRRILWAEQYAFDHEQIARQYRDLSVGIVLTLVDRIERIELARYDAEQDATAYHLYLAAQRHLRALDLPNVRRARRCFKAALIACPDLVPAISSLARTYQLEWLLMARGDSELLGEAERLARESIEVDPDDARGYRELGNCALFNGRFDESLIAFAEAEKRNPQHADLLADLSDALSHSCDPATGLQKINRAIELNPLCPDYYWWTAGGANFHLHRYSDAIECMSRMRDESPAFRLIAASHAMLGNKEQAAQFVGKTKDIHPDFSVSGWLSILPIRDRKYAQHYEQSLREAGFE